MSFAPKGSDASRCALERVPWFRDLPAPVRDDLTAICRPRNFAAGQIISDDGERPEFVGCVSDGFLRMQKTLPDGRQHIVGLLVEGDIFGRVFDGPLHFAVEAATDATICSFQRAPFEAMLSRSPDLERLVLRNVLNELDRARDWMMILSNRKVTGRLAGFLLTLCTRFRAVDHLVRTDLGRLQVKIPISRADLAHLLGTRQESLSRAFHALDDAGMIVLRTPYDVEIRDIDALIEESGDEDAADMAALEALFAEPARRAE